MRILFPWILTVCITAIVSPGSLQAQSTGTLEEDLAGAINMVVASNGSGTHTSIQDAINAIPNGQAAVIFIRKGEYREKINVPSSKSHLTLIGEDVDSTVIVYDDFAGRIVDGVELNTFTSQTIRIDAHDFKAMNLTFENDARPEGSGGGQNVAVSSYGDRSIFLHCRFVQGWRGRTAAWISVVGFGSVLFTYFGVNYLLSGLHSYA